MENNKLVNDRAINICKAYTTYMARLYLEYCIGEGYEGYGLDNDSQFVASMAFQKRELSSSMYRIMLTLPTELLWSINCLTHFWNQVCIHYVEKI